MTKKNIIFIKNKNSKAIVLKAQLLSKKKLFILNFHLSKYIQQFYIFLSKFIYVSFTTCTIHIRHIFIFSFFIYAYIFCSLFIFFLYWIHKKCQSVHDTVYPVYREERVFSFHFAFISPHGTSYIVWVDFTSSVGASERNESVPGWPSGSPRCSLLC